MEKKTYVRGKGITNSADTKWGMWWFPGRAIERSPQATIILSSLFPVSFLSSFFSPYPFHFPSFPSSPPSAVDDVHGSDIHPERRRWRAPRYYYYYERGWGSSPVYAVFSSLEQTVTEKEENRSRHKLGDLLSLSRFLHLSRCDVIPGLTSGGPIKSYKNHSRPLFYLTTFRSLAWLSPFPFHPRPLSLSPSIVPSSFPGTWFYVLLLFQYHLTFISLSLSISFHLSLLSSLF